MSKHLTGSVEIHISLWPNKDFIKSVHNVLIYFANRQTKKNKTLAVT